MNDEDISRAIEAAVREIDGRRTRTCAAAFEIARERGIALRDIGAWCNENGVRIRACQLGLFT
ncbi:MAG: hypothetical protein PHQ19_00175 [Candidatus Krumholzibacteria bacterium]|nr:hypothetical protein [Candidatus Krumholzibacteria bacterium]